MRKLLLKTSLTIVCALLILSTVLPSSLGSFTLHAEEAVTNASETESPQEGATPTLEQQNSTNSTEQQSSTNSTEIQNPTNSTISTQNKNGYQVAILTRHQKDYSVNGENKVLNQPVTEIDGVTYIPLKAIAEIYGFKVSYNAKTRESIAASDQLTLAFKQNTDQVKINNSTNKTIPSTITLNSSLMVPVRAWSQLTDTTLTLSEKEIKLEWKVGPSAAFKITNSTIFANQTTVEYVDLASSPNGATIVDEKWTGKEDIFPTAGKHTVTREVMDENGVWSIPYSVTIDVLKENLPPNAFFTTNKDTYKIGEPIIYKDLSTDDYKIKSVTWKNNEPVFFESGNPVVTIVVEDIYGLKSEYNKAITISNERLYTEKEYYYNFKQPGQKLTVEHKLALEAETIPYTIAPIENSTVVRLNSPEQMSLPGIDYKDTIEAGKVRFAYHKQNKSTNTFRINLFATNNNDFPVFITNDNFAMGGPSPYVNHSGKASTTKYFENTVNPVKNQVIEILPGETIQVLPKAAQIDIIQDRTISIFSDYSISGALEFTSTITLAGVDAKQALPTLDQLQHDKTHIRGTFKAADRKLHFIHVFGAYPVERIVLGDKVSDSNVTGVDAVTGDEIQNAGNGAVKYAFSLEVGPNQIIMLNGRGGIYSGSLLVNNKVVNMPEDGYLQNSTEAAVIYRTGDSRETVNINYIPAPGSNLPLSIIFDKVPTIEVEDVYKPLLNSNK